MNQIRNLALLEKLNPEKGYLTHMSHFIGKHEELDSKLPDFIHPAYDGLKIEI
jgi:phosphoribosyl 1,2-cyclic phosphate phosphodiesterase